MSSLTLYFILHIVPVILFKLIELQNTSLEMKKFGKHL
ncbi:hypothetical protein NUACC26_009210 [Scytonema sp. NUACC26]